MFLSLFLSLKIMIKYSCQLYSRKCFSNQTRTFFFLSNLSLHFWIITSQLIKAGETIVVDKPPSEFRAATPSLISMFVSFSWFFPSDVTAQFLPEWFWLAEVLIGTTFWSVNCVIALIFDIFKRLKCEIRADKPTGRSWHSSTLTYAWRLLPAASRPYL